MEDGRVSAGFVDSLPARSRSAETVRDRRLRDAPTRLLGATRMGARTCGLRCMFCVHSGSRANVIGHARVRLDSRTWRRSSVGPCSSCQPRLSRSTGLSGQFGNQLEILVDVQHGEL